MSSGQSAYYGAARAWAQNVLTIWNGKKIFVFDHARDADFQKKKKKLLR